ncbi:hypothetical protein C8J57DRAFT_1223681 [Mycena rebaudengoi]|nr:hypothetical protein C8J57DRAFT_1223681 [Mycena rebaudengoi]
MTTTTHPIPQWQNTFRRIRFESALPKPLFSTSTSCASKLEHDTIPISVSNEDIAYETVVITNPHAKTTSLWVYNIEDAGELQSSLGGKVDEASDAVTRSTLRVAPSPSDDRNPDTDLRAELASMRNEAATIPALRSQLDSVLKELEDMRRKAQEASEVELQYELASRTLYGVEASLFASLPKTTRNTLALLRINNYVLLCLTRDSPTVAEVRYARTDKAIDDEERAEAVEAVWASAIVAPYHALIDMLVDRKTAAGAVRNPAAHPSPTKQQFSTFAASLNPSIPTSMQQFILKKRRYDAPLFAA